MELNCLVSSNYKICSYVQKEARITEQRKIKMLATGASYWNVIYSPTTTVFKCNCKYGKDQVKNVVSLQGAMCNSVVASLQCQMSSQIGL